MFDGIENLNLFPTSASEIVVNILVALLCGLSIAWLYRRTQRGPGYSVNFANSIVLLAMITALVIMVIGNNLARAFGLVGAMSIIRFRTAVKDTRDIIFIFFGLSVGMAAGVGYYKVAVLGTLIIGVVLFTLARLHVAASRQKEYLLQFNYTTNGDSPPPYVSVMDRYCRRHKVINVKSAAQPDVLEVAYYVRMKRDDKSSEFVRELQKTKDVRDINLFFDEEQF
jgi:uncharacterized membrane protein YhiD involved in acid resistance